MKKIWLFSVVLFITNLVIMSDAFSALAATYYVDYSSGIDSNDGVTILSPLKHSPGDSNYSPSGPAPKFLSAGDTIYFKGGVQYNGTINVNWNGTLNNPITYDGNSYGTWGTGKSIIDGENTRYKGFIAGSNSSYVTINNFEIRNLKAHLTDDYGTLGVDIRGGSTNFTVKNCYFHDVGYWNNDGGKIVGISVQAWHAKGCVIDNNEITKSGYMGIDLVTTTNCIVSNNNIHHYVNWGVHVNPYYGNVTGTIIRGNTIHDYYQYGTPFWRGAPHPTDHPHTDGLFITADGTSYTISGTIIEQNKFYNDIAFTESDATADVYLESGSSSVESSIIRNNIFINPQAYQPIMNSGASTQVYNNTIYSKKPGTYALWAGNKGSMVVKNNIFITPKAYTWNDSTRKATISSDYNYFVSGVSSPFVQISSYSALNFSKWISDTGQDTHSTLVTILPANFFINISGYPLYSSSMNFKLQSGSPAINAGIILSGYTNDYSDATRIAPWDIGAFENNYILNTPLTPNAPSNIIVR